MRQPLESMTPERRAQLVRADRLRAYVASRCSDPEHPRVVALLRAHGWRVYDYRDDMAPLDSSPELLSAEGLRKARARRPTGVITVLNNREAIARAHVVVLLLPCGPSAAFEAGLAQGLGKPPVLYVTAPTRSEFLAEALCLTETDEELLAALWMTQENQRGRLVLPCSPQIDSGFRR